MQLTFHEEAGVGARGGKVEAGKWYLWQSSKPGVYLHSARRPQVAVDVSGRYQAAIVAYEAWPEASSFSRVEGGAATLVVTALPSPSGGPVPPEVAQQWRYHLEQAGYGDGATAHFQPLPMRNVRAGLFVPAHFGSAKSVRQQRGTPSFSLRDTLEVRLSAEGTQEWLYGVNKGDRVSGCLRLSYEYLRWMPRLNVTVRARRTDLLERLRGVLECDPEGVCYANASLLRAVWPALLDERAIQISGGMPTPGGEGAGEELLEAIGEEAFERWFESLFVPYFGHDGSDWYHGATADHGPLAQTEPLYRLQEGAPATSQAPAYLTMELNWSGWTWLRAGSDVDLNSILSGLDGSYVSSSAANQALALQVAVGGHPLVHSTALEMSYQGNGQRNPLEPVAVGPEGGVRVNEVNAPSHVALQYRARVHLEGHDLPCRDLDDEIALTPGDSWLVVDPCELLQCTWITVALADDIPASGRPASDQDDTYLIIEAKTAADGTYEAIEQSIRLTPSQCARLTYLKGPQQSPQEVVLAVSAYLPGGRTLHHKQTLRSAAQDLRILVTAGAINFLLEEPLPD